MKRVEIESAEAGDIVAVAGIEDIGIGDTIADRDRPKPLPPLRIDEPTIAMVFSANNSPWAGREGDFVTSRKLRERLFLEQRKTSACASPTWSNPTLFRLPGAVNFSSPSLSRPCAVKGMS